MSKTLAMPDFQSSYFKVGKDGISQFQLMTAYLGGSAFQTIVDNPVTAYRQLVQQYAKNSAGLTVDPNIAVRDAKNVFMANPLSASMSGVIPRLYGVLLKRIPKFGVFLGISFSTGNDGKVGMVEAVGASVLSAPFINPARMIEKQQRVHLKSTGKIKSMVSILKESAEQNFRPLFRGTVPLIGHSFVSAALGLVGQPKLQQKIESNMKKHMNSSMSNLLASAIVSPIYVVLTNPISRMEVIMQTAEISGKRISATDAIKEIAVDSKKFGLRGVFRGNGIGIVKAIISLSLFHEGRMFLTDTFKEYNNRNGFQ
jgi:hypothetical protein